MFPFKYSATAVLGLMRAATKGAEVPPRLLRATQAAAFGVFRYLPAEGNSTSVTLREETLRDFIRLDLWGHVSHEEADTFLRAMSRAGVISVTPQSAYSAEVLLSPRALARGPGPKFASGWYAGEAGALLGTLYELLDRTGAYVELTKAGLAETSGMSRSALKRGLSRLERYGLIVRQAHSNALRLAWSPTALKLSWQGVRRFKLSLAADGRSISVDARLRVRLPGGGVTFLPEGCSIEVPDQTVDEFFIDLVPDGRSMAPLAPIE